MDPTRRLVKTPKGWAVAKKPRPQAVVQQPAPKVVQTTYDQLAAAAATE